MTIATMPGTDARPKGEALAAHRRDGGERDAKLRRQTGVTEQIFLAKALAALLHAVLAQLSLLIGGLPALRLARAQFLIGFQHAA